MEPLTDQVALVTGATRGLGRAISLALARRGAKLVIVGRSTEESPNRALPGTLEHTATELRTLGAPVLPVRADLASPGDVDHVVRATLDEHGRCDICVHNAAVSFLGPFLDVSASKWRAALNVNLVGPVALTQGLLPSMTDRGAGRFVFLGSGAAFSDEVLQLPYAVSKLGIERLTTGLAHQVSSTGVAVNCIRIDGVIPTEAVELSAPHLVENGACTAEEFAEAVVWLLGRPTWFTGMVLTLGQLRNLGALQPK